MAARLLSFLAVFALLFMPLGMSAPVAVAAPHMAMEQGQHCPSSDSDDAGKSVAGGHCVSGCTLFLPQPTAPALPVLVEPCRASSPLKPSLQGLTPEMGTPPPKTA